MRSADKHGKIIQSATKVFAKKGFFNARISDIAKEAKVADGTIYLYFNNKFDILLSVFEEEIGELIEELQLQLQLESDPRRKLEIFIANHLSAMKKNRNLAEVIQIELRQSHKQVRDYRNTRFCAYVDIISSIVKEGQAAGLFRQDLLPGIVKRALFGALDEICRIWTQHLDTSYSLEQTMQQVIDLFLHGTLASPALPVASPSSPY
ncbi:MAG: TetR family transcriptional regulator [Desulfobulbaceae bacterium A2]|nr:MAG: TetR family transcriptional regulator [Desulfobulbaceae bacterium A2]